MKKTFALFAVLITISSGIVFADMRSDHKRIDAAQFMVDQQAQIDAALSRITTVKNRMNQLKTIVNNQIGATEAAEVQTVIDGMKTQLTDYAAAW